MTPHWLDLPIVGIDLEEAETVSFPEGNLVKKFEISKDILAADGVISVSKMKSHALTRMTGAIKNQFGVIPGARQSGIPWSFARCWALSQKC